jgi:hypothetical protein
MPSPTIKKPEEKREQTMSFFDALRQLSLGAVITSLSWGDESLYGYLGTDGRVMLHLADGIHTWIVTDKDFALNDWVAISKRTENYE